MNVKNKFNTYTYITNRNQPKDLVVSFNRLKSPTLNLFILLSIKYGRS